MHGTNKPTRLREIIIVSFVEIYFCMPLNPQDSFDPLGETAFICKSTLYNSIALF